MYEHKHQPPISRRHFVRRIVRHSVIATALVLGSLVIGMLGYHGFEHLAWSDAFVNAAMLLGGMGPVDRLTTSGGKLFAGLYALYAGLLFILVMGLIFAPFLHRLLHRFHWEERA